MTGTAAGLLKTDVGGYEEHGNMAAETREADGVSARMLDA